MAGLVIPIGVLGTRLLTEIPPPVADVLAVQWQSTSPRPPLRVVVNVAVNHKVVGSLILLFKEVVESHVSVGVSTRAVIFEAKPNHDIGHIPDVALATALAGTGAYFQSTTTLTLTAVGCVAILLR